MKFTPDWVVQPGQLSEPLLQVNNAHTGIPPLFFIPVDGISRIVGRQRSIGLPRMVVGCAQGSHATIRHVRAVLPGDLIMLSRHVGWIRGKLTERVVNPVHKEPLDVIAVALDCLFAAS